MANTRRVYAIGDGLYHVVTRIVASAFFLWRAEKDILLAMIKKAAKFGGIQLITYCIMDNHVHLIVYVPMRRPVPDDELVERIQYLYGEEKAQILFNQWREMEEKGRLHEVDIAKEKFIRRMYSLSDFVKTWKENYTQSYNRRHNSRNKKRENDLDDKRIGTIWAGRFKSILLNGEPHLLLIVALYVDLNPVRAHIDGVGRDPGNYAWSGIGAALAKNPDPDVMEGILTLGRLAGFANEDCTPEQAVERYHEILLEKVGGDIGELLETRFKVGENDCRFSESLRGREMSLFDLLLCRCRCFENGRALAKKASDLIQFAGSRPRPSVLLGYCSANGLRKTVVYSC